MSSTPIRFEARLLRPADTGKAVTWTFLLLPAAASGRLPTRSALTVEGTLNGKPFRANLEPDGARSHWLKVPRALRVAANAEPGDTVTLEIQPSAEQLHTPAPPDLRKALSAAPEAKAVWDRITPVARRDWVSWVVSAKKAGTRQRRIEAACDMLASGKRRVCCFDRSGAYSKALGAPRAAD
jgi:hypothetical protein